MKLHTNRQVQVTYVYEVIVTMVTGNSMEAHWENEFTCKSACDMQIIFVGHKFCNFYELVQAYENINMIVCGIWQQ